MYAATMDLRAICEDPALRDPKRMTVFKISPGVPYEPMQATKLSLHGDSRSDEGTTGEGKRGSNDNDARALAMFRVNFADFFMETKLDGERMQVRVIKIFIALEKCPPIIFVLFRVA